MILSALIVASVMLADVTPAAAASPATAPVAAAMPAEKPPEGRLVCRSEAVVGTLMTKKTCYRVAPRPTTDAKAPDPKGPEAKAGEAKVGAAKPVAAASN